jgi:hypothetical protein
MKIEDILVPIDFSPGPLRALDYASALVAPGGEVYLLHVIDADFLARVSGEGFCDAETARAQMQRKAEEQLQQIVRKFSLLNGGRQAVRGDFAHRGRSPFHSDSDGNSRPASGRDRGDSFRFDGGESVARRAHSGCMCAA